MFEQAIRAQLERWIHESDLTEEELARAAFHAIDKWLDEDVMGFESDE